MIKIAVLSDPHLGYSPDVEREQDAHSNLKLAFELILKQEPDLILIAGDVFHEKIAKHEVLGEAIELFSNVKKRMNKHHIITKVSGKDGIKEGKWFIPPVIAIWGTHEYRSRNATNPTQLLHKAGLIHVLHAESILVDTGLDRIGIHGLSGVPEQHSKEALAAWSPTPFTDGANILMLHQNFKELIPKVEHGLQFSDLPKGFDLYLLGHVHHTSIHKHPLGDKPIINIGSTVSTQMQPAEAKTPKGFYLVELSRTKMDVNFVELATRKLFYERLKIDGLKPIDILNKISELIKVHTKEKYPLKPMLRIKLEGVLAEGFSPVDLNINLKDENLILNFDKSNIRSTNFEEHSKLLTELKEKKLSVEQIGLSILRQNLKGKINLKKLENIFNLLIEGNMDQIENEL